MSAELLELSVAEIIDGIASGTVDAKELLDSYANWTEATHEAVGSFLSIDFDLARDGLDQALASKGPLAGLPLAVKDIFHVSGFPTTCASKILEGYKPPFESTVVEKLKEAGCVIYGKLNMDEFAMGSSNENSAYHQVHNPWDLDRAPGGSSGGSAAALAARQTPVTLGTDTGGSIRQPAAFCGITGLKPTYGRVSRYGLIAFASSLDQVGPMGRSAEDCAHLLAAISGHDIKDGTSLETPVASAAEYLSAQKKLNIGLPKEYLDTDGIDPEIRASINKLIEWCKQQGHTTTEISLPHTPYTTATYYLIATAEASSNLARFDGIRYGHRTADAKSLADVYKNSRAEGFGKEVKRRIMLGTFALSSGYYDAYYGQAQKARRKIREDFDSAFAKVDVILTPTTPTTAFKLGEKTADPLQMYLNDIFTNACNLAGIPGIGFPCGFDQNGLPIGAQLMAPALEEATLLSLVHQYQQDFDYHKKQPKFVQERLSS